MRSLRLRLFVFLLALAAVAALLVGGATYFSVRCRDRRAVRLPPAPDGAVAARPGPHPRRRARGAGQPRVRLRGADLVDRRRGAVQQRCRRRRCRRARCSASATCESAVRTGACSAPPRRCASCRWRSRWRCGARWPPRPPARSVLPIVAGRAVGGAGDVVAGRRHRWRRCARGGARRARATPRALDPLPLDGLPAEVQPLVSAFNDAAAAAGQPPSTRSARSSPMPRTSCARRSPR